MTKQTDQHSINNPMDPMAMASLKHWGEPLAGDAMKEMSKEVSVDCGWGRLIFGQTYEDPEVLAKSVRREKDGRRDIALYIRDPNIVLSYAPQELFLDPSVTLRLDFDQYEPLSEGVPGLTIRMLTGEDDEEAINRIYQARGMVPAYHGFYATAVKKSELTVLLALDDSTGDIVGAVTGVDHKEAFNDPDNGCSLWALVVDPQTHLPAVGEALSRGLIEYYQHRGRRFLDLSVLHGNKFAMGLYKKLGFSSVPAYCIKNKNSINEQLFIGSDPEADLNIYARIITNEARRRGIAVEVLDAQGGFFRLTLGGRSITCRESLSELTSAVAMSRCDDKATTRRLLRKEGLRVPDQISVEDMETVEKFVEKHERVVVKPARGEQGRGIKVDLSDMAEIEAAIADARTVNDQVLVEEFVRGEDVRIIVINGEVVAAAVRRPARIKGNGRRTIKELIEHQSRRRAAATHGESTIPMDGETIRCVEAAGYSLDDILDDGIRLRVRNTANLHTGGTIHDMTSRLHPVLEKAALRAADALEIPVVGFDFMVPDLDEADYVIIEANERPGLANHEPQPTVEKFIDLLFPYTKTTD